MKKGLIIVVVLALLCCVATAIGGYVVYNNYILPNMDSESTVTINGQQVTQLRRTPTTFNNMVIEPQVAFIAEINQLGKLANDVKTEKEVLKAQVVKINSMLDKDIETLDSYKTVLVQYNDYKDFIDATRTYYVQYKDAINKAYSESNIEKIFASQISQAEYNKIVADMDTLNTVTKKLDEDFGKAQDAFAAKFNVKLQTK